MNPEFGMIPTCISLLLIFSTFQEALLTALYLKPAPDLFFKLQQQLDIWEERRADEVSEARLPEEYLPGESWQIYNFFVALIPSCV